jgi:FkbM family methyltransferase
VFNIGLSPVSGSAIFGASGVGSSRFKIAGSSNVTIATIAEEAERLNPTLGLIKADVEGMECPVMLGALKTIACERPGMAMAIYDKEDFF